MYIARHARHRRGLRSDRGQALVELALVMPLMVGLIAVLFQFGILFIAYLSLVHEMRDIGRFAAVHPDTVDGTSCASASSLWAQMCNDAPSVIDPNGVTFSIVQGADGQKRTCTALSGGRCTNRPTGVELRMQMQYDLSKIMFLPASFRLGPWLNVGLNPQVIYAYSIMVEQH